MRRNIPTIFSIMTLVALILICACLAQSPADQSSRPGGLTQITPASEGSRLSFETAKQNFLEYRSESTNDIETRKNVNYMLSRDMDDHGNARTWIFGVYGEKGPVYLINDITGWTTIENVTLPSEKISLDTIVTPENLLKQNRAAILNNPSPGVTERWDLELQRGVYTLTITSGSSARSLIFNATTGALIS
ncbi:MAG TPA: hypothetical protein VFC43_05080 [Methanoregula sp.]|nr:hypothetical protein [Methanoregula sp.]